MLNSRSIDGEFQKTLNLFYFYDKLSQTLHLNPGSLGRGMMEIPAWLSALAQLVPPT